MSPVAWIPAAVVAALALVGAVAWLRRISPRGDVAAGLAMAAVLAYARVWHRVRVEGRVNVPRGKRAGPLIVVSNHSAGVDPILIQSACAFEIRWVMAQDMRVKAMEPLWRFLRILFVDRREGRSPALREGVRHVKEGGVLGVFPEGGIERPARTLHPFRAGIGLLVSRSGADVLPVVVEGTPEAETAWGSLLRRGRVRVRFLERISRSDLPREARGIAEALERVYEAATGWERLEGASEETVSESERAERGEGAEGDGRST